MLVLTAGAVSIGVGGVAGASSESPSDHGSVQKRGPRGFPGPQGPQGATGPQGPAGAPAEFGVTRKIGGIGIDPDSSAVREVDCPAGTHVIGGGVSIAGAMADLGALSVGSSNAFDSDTWFVELENHSTTKSQGGIAVTAYCVKSTLAKHDAASAGKRGPQGRPGQRGVTGPQGPLGPEGSEDVPLTYVSQDFSGAAGARSHGNADCGDGKQVVGGGEVSQGAFGTQWMTGNVDAGGHTWGATVDTFGDASHEVSVYAICEPDRSAGQGSRSTTVRPSKRGHHRHRHHGRRGPRGPQGPRGATGPQGQQGPPASDDVSLTLRYVTANVTVSPQTQGNTTAECPAGEHVVGGGVFGGPARHSNVNSSRPVGSDRWQAYVDNTGTTTSQTIQVTAICASPTTVAG